MGPVLRSPPPSSSAANTKRLSDIGLSDLDRPSVLIVVNFIKASSTTSATCIITSQACFHLEMSRISSAPYFCLCENRSQWFRNGS